MGVLRSNTCRTEAVYAGDGFEVLTPDNLRELLYHLQGSKLLTFHPQSDELAGDLACGSVSGFDVVDF